ncbi:Intersectin 1 (SH3 domain protein) [Mortierella sp. NVP85]|nr:Intersectin 1 (SH3 domain protein) [Mortierella sp. NVP85]
MALPTYIAHHRYDAEKDDELTLEVGDIIMVQDQSDPGWWVGIKVKDDKAGWFPSNFVDPHEELVETSTTTAAPAHVEPVQEAVAAPAVNTAATPAAEEAPEAPKKQEGPVLARVEYDYEAKDSGELSLETGRIITILDSSDPAWWRGDSNGMVGKFPSNYVKLIENKEEAAGGDKPVKFKLAAFGVQQGGLGSLFAGGVIPGLKKTGGLKKLGAVDPSTSSSDPVQSVPKSSPAVAAPPAATTPPAKIASPPPVAQEVAAPTPVRAVPPPAPATPPAPIPAPVSAPVPAPVSAPVPLPAPAAPVPSPPVETATTPEPRVPSRAKKPKAKQIRALVMFDYAAQEEDEIDLEVGTTIVVLDKMGDEGWWNGKNEQGNIGNFPSDFVQEIKEEAVVQPPPIATTSTPPPPPLQQQPASPPPPIATSVAAVQDESLKSPGHARPSVHAAVALPPIPVEPLQPEPVDTKESEVPPPAATPPPPSVATPPPPPRSARPVSVIVPSTSSTQLHQDAHPASPRATSPISPRQSSASTFSTFEAPTSPTHSIPGRLSRSSTMSRHERPIPEIPLATEETRQQDAITSPTTTTAPAAVEPPHSEGEAASITSSYILPTPVARSRPTPPLARPPSIHQTNENRKSVALPPVPSEPEEPVVHPPVQPVIEEEEEEAVEEKEEAPQPEDVGQQDHEATLPSPPETTAPTEVPSQEQPIAKEAAVVSPPAYQEAEVETETQDTAEEEAGDKTADVQEQDQEALQEVPAAITAPDTSLGGEEVAPTVEEKEPEVEPEKAKLPEMESSGPVLNHASRPRPAKGRKLPSAPAATPETSFASQLEADVKKSEPEPEPAPVVPEKTTSPPESASSASEKAGARPPPPKPIKPIFQKFPTPFAGTQPVAVALRPTGRRLGSSHEESAGAESTSSSSSTATTPSTAGGNGNGAPVNTTPPVGGVKSLTSRFAPPAGGGNTAALELEIAKLRRYMNEELDRVKRELAEERESREKLQAEVNQLKAQLQG